LAAMIIFRKALVFEYKNGESLLFPQTVPLIVRDQKVIAGALNALV